MLAKRNFVALVVIFAIVTGFGIAIVALNQNAGTSDDDIAPNIPDNRAYGYPVNETLLHEYEKNLNAGGPPPDGIPPIDKPEYWTASEAEEYLNDADIVFGLALGGVILAFPQRVMVWHEIVNEVINGTRVTITYCPLTGSAIAFRGNLPGNDTTFGTSGRLINSNLVMYDRATNSYFPQILSQAINKNYLGYRLEKIHMVWTQWGKWKDTYPDTIVLSTDTGYVRDYSWDPYGSYSDANSYYYSEDILFPVMNTDDRLYEKDVVIGVETIQGQYAIQKQVLRTENLVQFDIGNESFVAFYDSDLDTVRTFSREFQGVLLDFIFENGTFVDRQMAYNWSVLGDSTAGNLVEIANMDVMWYSWVAYFPSTGLTCTNC